MENNTGGFIRVVKHPFKFRLFLLSKLPSAYFAGVRIREMDENRCVVTVPYKWFSKNPFRSTYFACLAMAGEMSTGALAMAWLYKQPPISLLVVNVHAEYQKKATGITTFICEEGPQFRRMIDEAIQTGEVREVKARTIGRNDAGEVVAEMYVTWSFKIRNKK
jgi:hypothetical protein